MKRTRVGILAGLLLITGAALAIPASAQPPSSAPSPQPSAGGQGVLSLAAVLEHAVRQSPALSSARIDVAVAEASVLEATGIEDFLLNLTGTYLRRRSEPIGTNPFSTNDLDEITGSFSLTKLLWTGGTIALRGDAIRDRTPIFDMNDPSASMLGTGTTTSLRAEIEQPLLRGRGETPTRAERTRAQLRTEQARLDREATSRSEVRDLVIAYWEVAYAWADLEIRRSSLEVARERRRLTEASVRGGATAPTEILAVDQAIAEREEEVVVAELTVTQRSLDLRVRAGLEIEPAQIDVRVDAPLAAPPVRPIQMEEVMAQALQSSPEIARLESQGKGAVLEVEVTDNGILPRLDVRVFGGPFGTGTEVADSIRDIQNGYQVGGSVVLEHWLGNRTARGASRRFQAERERVRVNMADMRRRIAEAAARAVALARSAEKRMQLSRTAIDLTQKNIKAETGRFELGRSTNFDVLLRQDEHTRARLRYARAAADYLNAVAVVEDLTGAILAKYGIKVE